MPFAPDVVQSGWQETENFLKQHRPTIEQKNIYRLFAVTPKYVLTKVHYLLSPFPQKYSRVYQLDSSNKEVSAPPYQDTSSPDLYLPFLSLLTFSLLRALLLFKRQNFKASSVNSHLMISMLLTALFGGILKFMFPFCTFIEGVAFSGYAFLSLALTLLCRFVGGGKIICGIVLTYTSLIINFKSAKVLHNMGIYYRNTKSFASSEKRKEFTVETSIKLLIWFLLSFVTDMIVGGYLSR